METPLSLRARLIVSVVLGAALAAGVAAFSPGSFWGGWLAGLVIGIPAVFFLMMAWCWAGGGRVLAWMVALAFLLRLVTGIGLSIALPIWGYDQPAQEAGYLFKDASARDQQAWGLAVSDQPLGSTFRAEFISDQYGGLLGLSAAIYRFLSPDTHRPFLILFLASFFTALGVPFLVRAARLRWSERIAVVAGWVMALYPDAVFFSSSQMREPFLVSLLAIAFWGVLAWRPRNVTAWLAIVLSLLGMGIFSSRVAAAAVGFLGLLFLLENVVRLPDRRLRAAGWVAVLMGCLLVLAFSWEWFQSSTIWDVTVTESDSGWVDKIIQEAADRLGVPGSVMRFPIVVGYGVTRPVLPAALAQPSESVLWRVIGIIRSFGWYTLAPFLVYGFFTVWREADRDARRRLLWLAATVLLWTLIASARGGGDSTDNPRYRSLLIPWFALLAAWSLDRALARRDVWLWRWILVEAIFLGFFTNWYFSRYYQLWRRMYFWEMGAWIIGLSALVLVGGWLWDNRKPGRLRSAPGARGK